MRFILKCKKGKKPDLKKATVTLDIHGANLVDGSLFPVMVLIDLEETDLRSLKEELDQEWEIYPEKIYQVPSPRKVIKK
ncbi:hypothetical protein AY601_0594 [Pedobacter cryoconitis]|uniref:Uncharacterized protein n=1 Tax=Pedobacter cryoconitis TaxID=188932 RepID=A0A127V8G4_9SPHI|nr:hypothetical protein [Pedobacter cryoconitis]AMP97545.1 hypothetical protein AY601_0594 [Pedobacter cryoconitis]